MQNDFEREPENFYEQRNLDDIEDDLKAIINIKKEFLRAVQWTAELLGKKLDKDAIVSSEEHLDDALNDRWMALIAEYRAHKDATIDEPVYPESSFMRESRLESAKLFRPQPTRGMAPQNGATPRKDGNVYHPVSARDRFEESVDLPQE